MDFLSNDSSRVQVVVTRAVGERVHVDMTDRVAGKDVGATSGKERAEEQLIASGCGGSNHDGLPKSRGSWESSYIQLHLARLAFFYVCLKRRQLHAKKWL